jgi:hypothetical protein
VTPGSDGSPAVPQDHPRGRTGHGCRLRPSRTDRRMCTQHTPRTTADTSRSTETTKTHGTRSDPRRVRTKWRSTQVGKRQTSPRPSGYESDERALDTAEPRH